MLGVIGSNPSIEGLLPWWALALRNRYNAAIFGPRYWLSPNASIGMKMNGKKTNPSPNQGDLPKSLAISHEATIEPIPQNIAETVRIAAWFGRERCSTR